MPNTSSATKALRQAQSRTKANVTFKIALKRSIKTVSQDTMAQTTSMIDKAVKRNLIHKNKAARLKSQLAKTHGIATAKRPSAGKANATVTKAAKPAVKKTATKTKKAE
jgi:small subunit ribosomal protein S20